MAMTLRMSPTEFEESKRKLIKLSLEVHTLARLILVDGKTLTDASKEVGMSKQNAAHHMRRVKAMLNDLPASWVQFDEWMPDWLATETREKLKVEKEKLKKQ